MKQKKKQPQKKARSVAKPGNIKEALKTALRRLHHGDPVEAASCVDLVLKQTLTLDFRKQMEKAHEEITIGNPERGENMLEFALLDLERTKGK